MLNDSITKVVSIHAPARGATQTSAADAALGAFQFTRPQEARPGAQGQIAAADEFQFTRPQEARLERPLRMRRLLFVSIHAPARGATEFHTWEHADLGFQFTRPQEARQ